MSIAIQQYLSEHRIVNTNVYSIPTNKFKTLDVKSWKYNRPPDTSRIPEIHEWMKQFQRMDGVLNLAYIVGEGLVCFEGNHRRLALDGLVIIVFVDIVWDATHESITHEFRRLNKSVCVPDLYVIENDSTIRGDIEKVVSEFRKKYPTLESNSGRPQRPNYNRDKLTDDILRIHKDLMIPSVEINERLNILNEKYKLKDRTKLSEKTIQKCESSGLWLFAWNNSINISDLE
jgi:hypothetical protein